MNWQIFFFVAARVFGGLFMLLVAIGVISRIARRFDPRLARRRGIQAAAAGRYARGEIDAEALRVLRADLKDLA